MYALGSRGGIDRHLGSFERCQYVRVLDAVAFDQVYFSTEQLFDVVNKLEVLTLKPAVFMRLKDHEKIDIGARRIEAVIRCGPDKEEQLHLVLYAAGSDGIKVVSNDRDHDRMLWPPCPVRLVEQSGRGAQNLPAAAADCRSLRSLSR